MTLILLHPDVGSRDRGSFQSLARRVREHRHLLAAVVTALCVGGGFALVMTTAPRPATPGNVAREFVEARIAQDWDTVWQLHCRSGGLPGQEAFVAQMAADQNGLSPEPAVVFVEDVGEDGAGPGLSFTVSLVMAGFDLEGSPWREAGRLPVIGEEGEFRVCIQPEGTS